MRPFRARETEPEPTPLPGLQGLLQNGTPSKLTLWLANSDHDVLDDEVAALTEEQAAKLSHMLTPASAGELLESISPHTAADLLKKLPLAVAAGLLDSVQADDATRIIELMSVEEQHSFLHAMKSSHSALIRGLLAWPEDSAASWMRPEFLHVRAGSTMADAVAAARREPEYLEEGVFVVTGVGAVPALVRLRESAPQGKDNLTPEEFEALLDYGTGKTVVGWLSHQAMVLAKRAAPVEDHMVPASRVEQWSVRPLDDQETVAHRVRERDAEVLAVMDDSTILGVITHDAVRDILSEEAREDAELQGGSSPLDVPYLQASPAKLWSKRVIWLLVLFLAEAYTGNVLRAFEDSVAQVTALMFFIPLLIGTGGNVGTQITTTLVRAMSVEGVQLRDAFTVIWKETRTAVLLGLTMAAAGIVRAWTLGVTGPLMLTVGTSLALIVLWASLVASILPLVLRSLRVDPAVVSGPMIATIVDGTGLVIYFLMAHLFIPGLA